jgi:large subunit ribosomal protein L31
MKDGIHPDYHEITVIMTDGTSYKTRSTYGKPGDTLNLEIDSKSHPAWTGGQQRLSEAGGQLARFKKRFQGFGMQQHAEPEKAVTETKAAKTTMAGPKTQPKAVANAEAKPESKPKTEKK